MTIDRRLFLGGTAALAAPGLARAAVAGADTSPAEAKALAAIADYLEAHRRWFALPAMAIVVVAGGRQYMINSGNRDYEGRAPLAGDELWQIGSISKSFIAAICLQLADEKKLDLDADIRTVLPEAPLPDAPFTIRALLDHSTGLPDFAPSFGPAGYRLWTGFKAGSHWSYSNTGYDLLGHAIARIDGRPLADSIEVRIARPLGMTMTRGAINWRDRSRYPASYATLRPDRPVLRQNALAPAPWVDASLGAGSVASTLTDMARYLRFLIGIGRGQGGGILSAARAAEWLAKPVVQDAANPAETYGLGLMHRQSDGRALLHHTGGMVSFSSSFHVDAAAGTGAFASCAIGGTGYRPRLLTAYAVQAMRLAAEGKAPPAPPALAPPPPPAAALATIAGSYGPLMIAATPAGLVATMAGTTAPLELRSPDQFVTAHPALADFAGVVVRDKDRVIAIDHGPHRYVRDGMRAPLPPTPPRLAARAGRYQSDDPWIGGATLVARGDQLLLEGTDAITEIGDDVWRLAEIDWLPERITLMGTVNGRPQVADFSGRLLERRDG
ncbi:MAG: hypothetical protein CFE37_03450 [Alphaproteobacteria bacterium PA4]|nr:MAG: hypothetical protein CFE37_03450 [Alphaproteobacteria bacterium PA4]